MIARLRVHTKISSFSSNKLIGSIGRVSYRMSTKIAEESTENYKVKINLIC